MLSRWRWMNENAGAVQAVAAMIVAGLTAVLIGVTCWYATLTRRMALSMERQLASSFQPTIEMALSNRFQGQGSDGRGNHTESVSGTVIIRNKGSLPMKIVSVSMKLIYDKQTFPDHEIRIDAKSRVVAPGETTQFVLLTINVPIGGSTAPYEQIAQIHCSDLAGVSKHSFAVSSRQEGQLIHCLGFQRV